MKSLLRSRRPRHIASVMLFVWLFATFASWAHACLVQPAAVTAHAHGPQGPAGEPAGQGALSDEAAGVGGSHEPDPAREACAAFCAAEQSIVAKAQPAKGDGGADPLVLPPAVPAGWPAFMPGHAQRRWRPLAAPPPPGRSLVIAFLRLTL